MSQKPEILPQQEQEKQNLWLAHLPDYPQPDTLSKRLIVRSEHLAAIEPKVKSGKILMGGATFDRHPTPKPRDGRQSAGEVEGEAQPKMTGSVMIVSADSEDEVWDFIRGDVYAKCGVWDLDAVMVRPFKLAAEGFSGK